MSSAMIAGSSVRSRKVLRNAARSANIQVGEACDALQRYADGIDMDPARRDWVEERLDAFQSIARKHRAEPGAIPDVYEQLRAERDELDLPSDAELEADRLAAILDRDLLLSTGGEQAGE